MMKLAERMVISFCAGVSASTAHTWTTLSGTGANDVRVMTRKSVDDPGRPLALFLVLPLLFGFLLLLNESLTSSVMKTLGMRYVQQKAKFNNVLV